MSTHELTDIPETLRDGARIETIDDGFRLQSTDEHVVEVWRYMFNWRLVSMLPNQNATTERGYCFFGTDLESLARAVAAGLAWENPLRSDPEGFDKRAF